MFVLLVTLNNMKKYFIILLVLCNTVLIVTSCKSRCTRGEQKAFDMPKDSRLIGMWRRLNVFPKQEEYMQLLGKGIRKSGITKDTLDDRTIWYTLDNYFYNYSCNKGQESLGKDRYVIKHDTLTLIEKNPICGELKTLYVRVKE